ncbi:MAG: FHA domain-containing protein [Deltaproteobacteria bacterium]|nr:FHA domain-containing protein [Deltaproteobacteria bacterium]
MAEAAPLRTLLGIQEPDKPSSIIVWDTEEITIGRLPENDIVLEDPDASRRHGRFVRNYSGYQVEDLGTANGTFVNGDQLDDLRQLANKDVIKIGEVQIRFIQTRKDPKNLGMPVAYASELKDFDGKPAAGANPESTTLGLLDPVSGSFGVGSVGDFVVEPGITPAEPRNLDLEFGDIEPPASASPGDGKLSLHLELEGLTPDLQRSLEALLGKEIELPALRIKIKEDDGL